MTPEQFLDQIMRAVRKSLPRWVPRSIFDAYLKANRAQLVARVAASPRFRKPLARSSRIDTQSGPGYMSRMPSPSDSTFYYRIQPAGLSIKKHRTAATDGRKSGGIDVFKRAVQTLDPDGLIEAYGDEVLVIRADGDWDNGDYEGVRIDPKKAEVVRRLSYSDWLAAWERALNATVEGGPWRHKTGRFFEAEDAIAQVDSDDEQALLIELGLRPRHNRSES